MNYDLHSLSNSKDVFVRHIRLDLDVDFGSKRIIGRASLYLSAHNARELVVDTQNLYIKRVTVGASQTDADFMLGDEIKYLGRPLSIKLPPKVELVHIDYMTEPQYGALQWLEPNQTADGCHPFLFTQSQTIFARTWIPCQDTPGLRTTFYARVKVPKGLMAVMSARNPTEKNFDGIYEFESKQPIPSYLFALAVGDIAFRSLGERSGVYGEGSILASAAHEFADLEAMIQVAESLYGKYSWDRFDLIVLPPSFPFGGMENPQIAFVTPTLLAGDRSLTAVIAHELAHSWSGNLVTNATWNDFWLNEAFTVYTEHRIMEKLNGKNYDDMLSLLSLRGLKKEMANLPTRDTWLYLDLNGRHPNDCLTDVPYEKGYFFLRMLEDSFGREKWDKFINEYFENFAFQSISTPDFVVFLRENLIGDDRKLEEKLNIAGWIYGPGLPNNCPKVFSSELEQVEAQCQAFNLDKSAKDFHVETWTTHHWVYFLTHLESPVPESKMEDLDATFQFTRTRNAEILYNWLLLGVASDYSPIDSVLESFLISQGRLKYLKPLYLELTKTSSGKLKAKRIYRHARSTYHSAAVQAIDEILMVEKHAISD